MIPLEQWGRDHFSLLLYLETLVVDHKGVIDAFRMGHNDWAFLDDMEEAGLLISFGDPVDRIELTGCGWMLAHELRRWKGERRNLITFKIEESSSYQFMRETIKKAVEAARPFYEQSP